MSGDISSCHERRDATIIQWVEARGAVKHLQVNAMHKTAPHNKEFSGANT